MTVVHSKTLLSNQLWAKHEAYYFKAFFRALELLGEKSKLPRDEVSLNRELYFCLLRANRELDPDGTYPPPMTECSNQPDPDDETRAKREDKRPDFNWGFTDPHEANDRNSAKQFTVECKRLGIAPRTDWILNENYVEHGVWRFMDPAWGYANRFPSALMVGYWQTMNGERVLREVNQAVIRRGLTALALSEDGWQTSAVSKLQQVLVRSLKVSPFRLYHLWVDFRGR